MTLATLWFILIAFFWTGYFVLEGFDFGVGMLSRIVGRDEREREAVLGTIGPVWDGNEVWVLVAGGATFAAFPEWYATLFSGFYLPLLLILVGLIVRGVALEYRNKEADARWRSRWDLAIQVSSVVPALLWGVAFGNILHGVPIDANREFVGTFLGLLNPFALLTGLVTLSLFLTHGALFLALKTDGDLRGRSRSLAGRIGLVAAAVTVALAVWIGIRQGTAVTWTVSAVAAAALVGSLVANRAGREGLAFAGSAVTIGGVVVTAFSALYPAVMPSTLNPAWSMTIANASSTPHTLRIMTVAALIGTPVVLAYQIWTYWVFRQRVSVRPQAPARPASSARTQGAHPIQLRPALTAAQRSPAEAIRVAPGGRPSGDL